MVFGIVGRRENLSYHMSKDNVRPLTYSQENGNGQQNFRQPTEQLS